LLLFKFTGLIRLLLLPQWLLLLPLPHVGLNFKIMFQRKGGG
jgi:hypothetical protein